MSEDPYAWMQAPERPGTDIASNDATAPYVAPGLKSQAEPPPDKYRAAALDERSRLEKAGVPLPSGYTNRLGMGAGAGWLDEAMAAGTTPLEMIKQGTANPAEAYRYALARERLNNEKTRENTAGIGGTAAELLGGAAAFGGAAAGVGPSTARIAVPFTEKALPAWVGTVGKNAGIGAGIGAVAGAGDAEKSLLEDPTAIPKSLAMGGILGAGVGAVAPPLIQGAGKVLGAASRAIQAPRMFAPQNVADARVLEIARAAGVEPAEIAARVAEAAKVNQPYTVGDAIGNEGARALAGQAKTPGAQREAIVEALTTRKMAMPQRISEQVAEDFNVPGTAQAATDALIESAGAQSAPKYREAEANPTWSSKLQTFIDDPIAKQGLRHGVEIQRLRALGTDQPFKPTDAMITNFNEAGEPIYSGVPNVKTLQTLKVGLDEMISNAINPATGKLSNYGAALTQFKNNMLREMDAINPAYAEARALYSEPMRIKDAVKVGQDMVTRGRSADTVPAFHALNAPEQQGVRIGYADKALQSLELTGNIPTILRAKSPKGAAEINALAQNPDRFRQFMNREEQMQRHETKAIGGPTTAENLADMAAGDKSAGEAVGSIKDAVTGNVPGLALRAWNQFSKYAQGNSQAQRMAITRALLETDPTAAQAMAQRLADRQAKAAYLESVAQGGRTRPYWARQGGATNVP